jgi:hypothetical protein
MTCLLTRFNLPSTNNSLVVATKPKVNRRETVRTKAILRRVRVTVVAVEK